MLAELHNLIEQQQKISKEQTDFESPTDLLFSIKEGLVSLEKRIDKHKEGLEPFELKAEDELILNCLLDYIDYLEQKGSR